MGLLPAGTTRAHEIVWTIDFPALRPGHAFSPVKTLFGIGNWILDLGSWILDGGVSFFFFVSLFS